MCFIINLQCPCCRDELVHCKADWDKFHNGQRDKDYEPPKFYGESMMSEKVQKGMEEFGIKHDPSIKPDKKRKYVEGEYGH